MLISRKRMSQILKIKTKRDKIWKKEIEWCFVIAWRQKERVTYLERKKHKKIEWQIERGKERSNHNEIL
jgi:hypothetical protein